MASFLVYMTEAEAKVAACMIGDIAAWGQHAVTDRIRRATNDVLSGSLAKENPEWSLEKMLDPAQREAVHDALRDDMSLVLGGRALSSTHPAAGLVLAALVLPTRAERDTHAQRQRPQPVNATRRTPP